MEQKIKTYEKFIAAQLESPPKTPKDLASLREYHEQTLSSFQHERLIHLLITLFFAAISIAVFMFTFFIGFTSSSLVLFCVSAVLSVILIVITLFYVKHYYSLENHIQKLYDTTEKLFKLDP